MTELKTKKDISKKRMFTSLEVSTHGSYQIVEGQGEYFVWIDQYENKEITKLRCDSELAAYALFNTLCKTTEEE